MERYNKPLIPYSDLIQSFIENSKLIIASSLRQLRGNLRTCCKAISTTLTMRANPTAVAFIVLIAIAGSRVHLSSRSLRAGLSTHFRSHCVAVINLTLASFRKSSICTRNCQPAAAHLALPALMQAPLLRSLPVPLKVRERGYLQILVRERPIAHAGHQTVHPDARSGVRGLLAKQKPSRLRSPR